MRRELIGTIPAGYAMIWMHSGEKAAGWRDSVSLSTTNGRNQIRHSIPPPLSQLSTQLSP